MDKMARLDMALIVAVGALLVGCSRVELDGGRVVQEVDAAGVVGAVYGFWNSKQAQIDRQLLNPSLSAEQRGLLLAESDRLNNQVNDLVQQLKRMEGYEVIVTVQLVPGDVGMVNGELRMENGKTQVGAAAPTASVQGTPAPLIEPRAGEESMRKWIDVIDVSELPVISDELPPRAVLDEASPHADGTAPRTTRPAGR